MAGLFEQIFGFLSNCIKFVSYGQFYRVILSLEERLYDQLEVHEALTDFPAVDIFVAHNSPRLIHDREDGIHLGFEAFTNYVERARPRLLLHGHQHVNAESTLLFTRVVGTYGYRYVEIFPRLR